MSSEQKAVSSRYLPCPVCQKKRVRVNSGYSTLLRCDYCGSEWRGKKAFQGGASAAQRIAPFKEGFSVVDLLQLRDKLQHWGGKIVEFLDYFEGSYEDDEDANEARKLQREGLRLGLVRVRPDAGKAG